MTHFQLVQAATDLMSETNAPDHWIDLYDAAMASSTDRALGELVGMLSARLHRSLPIAA